MFGYGAGGTQIQEQGVGLLSKNGCHGKHSRKQQSGRIQRLSVMSRFRRCRQKKKLCISTVTCRLFYAVFSLFSFFHSCSLTPIFLLNRSLFLLLLLMSVQSINFSPEHDLGFRPLYLKKNWYLRCWDSPTQEEGVQGRNFAGLANNVPEVLTITDGKKGSFKSALRRLQQM